MLTIGDRLPHFDLAAVKGGPAGLNLTDAFTRVTDATNTGKWKLVFFWPKDFTFIGPAEIVAFDKLAADFADRDTVVYGVSTDSEFVHLNWRLHHDDLRGLSIPMLADVKRELTTALGILDKAEGVALRATFLVDPQGIIQFAAVGGRNGGRNPQDVLRALDTLQSDELCPRDWNAGDELLQPAA